MERVNRTVQQKLHAWMKKNNSQRWSTGCKTAQWQVNSQYHATVKNVPYVLTFGQKPRVGISNLLVDKSVIDRLHTKKELNQVTNDRIDFNMNPNNNSFDIATLFASDDEERNSVTMKTPEQKEVPSTMSQASQGAIPRNSHAKVAHPVEEPVR